MVPTECEWGLGVGLSVGGWVNGVGGGCGGVYGMQGVRLGGCEEGDWEGGRREAWCGALRGKRH